MTFSNNNSLVFFYTYFTAQIIFTVVNVYLPIYFFNTLNVNRTQLAFVQFLAYSALFVKPIISLYFDKKQQRKKMFLILSSIVSCAGFALLLYNLALLIVFGIFLGITLAFLSVLDVIIDKIIVETSETEKEKGKNVLIIQLGAAIGVITGNVIAMLIFSDFNSIFQWNVYFGICITVITPIIFFSFFIKEDFAKKEDVMVTEYPPIVLKTIVLMCIFTFLAYADRLWDYVFEPWFVNKYTGGDTSIFTILMLVWTAINILGYFITTIVSKHYNRKKLLTLNMVLTGVILIIAPFQSLLWFVILISIMQITTAFALINFCALTIHYSHKRVWTFQLIATFTILARVIFTPIGTFLSDILMDELISVISGILLILSIVPLLLIKEPYY